MTKEYEMAKEMNVEAIFIINIFLKDHNHPESLLVDVLGRLNRLDMSQYTLKTTLIGKTVAALKKHGSEQIRVRASALVDKWKRVVELWLADQRAKGETYTVSKEAKTVHAKTNKDKPKKALVQEEQKEVENKTEFLPKPKTAVSRIKGKPSVVLELPRQSNKDLIQKKPLIQEGKSKGADEGKKLQAAAKRLRENYQQADNAKRQRRIQVIELYNLPKKGLGQKNAYLKSTSFATKRSMSCK